MPQLMEALVVAFYLAHKVSMRNRKAIIISVAIGVLLIVLLLCYFLKSKDHENIVTEPVIQKSITTTSQKAQISIRNIVIKEDNYEIYTISQTFKLDIVRNLALGNGFKLTTSDENKYYLWQKGDDVIAYDMVANTLSVSGMNIFLLEQIDDNVFSNIAQKYFNEEWEYEISSKNEKAGRTEYLAQRRLPNGLHVESRENKKETDRIVIENGRITSATLTLAKFSPTGEYAPLLDGIELRGYINKQEYPKEILPSYDSLNSVIGMGYYESYEEVAKTLSNCEAEKMEVVYYYKYIDQGVLTPVYKAISMCEVTYKKKRYQIPAVIYMNGIDPNLISDESRN